ncbi:hypothetical protein V6N11_015882 [Hibiscus sabdariffa]|uniref:Uncharacterized protein n=1 Tax=Hibiscus sabdariffa TaxID=183260 RepID=A0ABR2TTP0_9ROSI
MELAWKLSRSERSSNESILYLQAIPDMFGCCRLVYCSSIYMLKAFFSRAQFVQSFTANDSEPIEDVVRVLAPVGQVLVQLLLLNSEQVAKIDATKEELYLFGYC